MQEWAVPDRPKLSALVSLAPRQRVPGSADGRRAVEQAEDVVPWDEMDIDIKEGLVKKYSQLHNVSKTSHLHCLKCVVYELGVQPFLIFPFKYRKHI